tara:strand:+ start:1504 stop:2271 length:768 start_codon:yes stop_codon:yes gene_type:complete
MINRILFLTRLIKVKGIKFTINKIIQYPYQYLNKKYKELIIFRSSSVTDRFTKIYELNYWDGSTPSGTGSELSATESIRSELINMYEKFHIHSVVDAPCGDYNWMKLVNERVSVKYTGVDIVSEVIKMNNKYQTENIKFIQSDICNDSLPNADLLIVRDCLFHFSYKDIKKFFDNFRSHSYKYILLTCHINDEALYGSFTNKDIETGDYRRIDLFSSPFLFKTEDVLYSIKDYVAGEPKKYVFLFKRETIFNIGV